MEPGPNASRLARLKAGPRHIERISWPGDPSVEVGVRVLRGSEIQQAELAAMQIAKSAPDSGHLTVVVLEVYEAALATELLHRALVDPETLAPFAASAGELNGLLTRKEIEFLLGQIERVALEDARALGLAPEELVEEAERLGKASPSATPSSGTSEGTPATSSDSAPRTAATASSSTSSPAHAPSRPRFRKTSEPERGPGSSSAR